MTHAPTDARIVIYDDTCIFCTTWAQYVLKRDKKRQLYFTPLFGSYAQTFFTNNNLTDTEALWLLEPDGTYYHSSTAVLRAVASLGGAHKVVLLALLVPRLLRDGIYGLIARHRHKLFKNKTCPILSDDFASRVFTDQPPFTEGTPPVSLPTQS